MDLNRLLDNYRRSGRLCASGIDRLKFLVWLYGRRLPIDLKLQLRLAFEGIGEPLDLLVRSNNSDGFIIGEVFEQRCYDLKIGFPPKTILDLGANIGASTIFFGRRSPYAQLACVEPMPQNIGLLEENLQRNQVKAAVFAQAVSVAEGELAMEVATKDSEHKVALEESADVIPVPAITVEQIMERLGWDEIDLCKIDIEGYEATLLQENCEWLNRVKAICIELHPPLTETAFQSLMRAKGFEVELLDSGLHLCIRHDVAWYRKAELGAA